MRPKWPRQGWRLRYDGTAPTATRAAGSHPTQGNGMDDLSASVPWDVDSLPSPFRLRGRSIGSAIPDPFVTCAGADRIALHGDERRRYEAIRDAKLAKHRLAWERDPSRFHLARAIALTRAELQAALEARGYGTDARRTRIVRKCAACGRYKEATEYYRHRRKADGLESSCIACVRTRRQARRAAARRALPPHGPSLVTRRGQAPTSPPGNRAVRRFDSVVASAQNPFTLGRNRPPRTPWPAGRWAPRTDILHDVGLACCTLCSRILALTAFGSRADRPGRHKSSCHRCLRRDSARRYHARRARRLEGKIS